MNTENLSYRQMFKEEKDLLGAVLKWLEKQPKVKIMRICDRYHRGYSDIFLCVEGIFIAAELKDDIGTASPHQKEFILDIIKAGGEASECRTVQDVINLVDKARKRAQCMTIL